MSKLKGEAMPLMATYVEADFPTVDSNTLNNKVVLKYVEEEYFEEDDDEENIKLKIELFTSITSGDCNKIERAMNNGAIPGTTCFTSRITACHYAAFCGHLEILQALIKRGADAEKKDSEGRSPLDYAIWNGHEDCVKELLETPESDTVIEKGDIDKSKSIFILDERANIPKETKDIWSKTTPLHLASARTHSNCVRLLIDKSHNPKAVDENEYTPLDVCGEACKTDGKLKIILANFESTLKILIKYENIEFKPKLSRNQSNPLHKSVSLNSKEGTKLLVDIAAYRNGLDENGQTPLHNTVKDKKKNLLALFLYHPNSKFNDVDFSNQEGMTSLHVAITIRWRKGIAMLLKAGADLMIPNKKGDTSLHIAAGFGAPFILQDIIKGFNDKENQLEYKNHAGETALFKAVEQGNEKRVNILLSEGASIKHVLKNGYNILHVTINAMVNNNMSTKILKTLLTANASLPIDEQILNNRYTLELGGWSPLHLAASKCRLDCLKVLIDFKADLFEKTLRSNYTALHLAANKGNLDVIKCLVEKNSDLMDARDGENWKPFYRAVNYGHRDCVTYFLHKGADLSETLVKNGKTKTVMNLLVNNLPRSANYLENLFNSYITKNECAINDECCEITIDYSVLMPGHECREKEKVFDNQMSVVVELLSTGRRMKQRPLLLHPFIESFLYMKWMNGMRNFYAVLVALFFLYVASLTLTVLRIYRSPDITEVETWNSSILCVLIGFLAFQETVFISILFIKSKMKSYFRRRVGFLNWISIILAIMVVLIDHSVPDRNWPKFITASAILLAWLQITILLSHFPECGYTFQMFSTVAWRALKVVALFGIYVIAGFALSFWVLFHGQPAFNGTMDSVVKTIVMTSEFDYTNLFSTFENNSYRIVVQLIFVMFLFLVPVVMMNLILALIISDTKDLETKGKIKRLIGQVHLIDILDTVVYFVMKSRSKKVQRTMKIYPGRPAWENLSLVSKNLEESLFEIVVQKKSE